MNYNKAIIQIEPNYNIRRRMKGLRNKRLESKYTLKFVAENIGVSLKSIYQYEVGSRFPRRETLEKLASFFACSIDELM